MDKLLSILSKLNLLKSISPYADFFDLFTFDCIGSKKAATVLYCYCNRSQYDFLYRPHGR